MTLRLLVALIASLLLAACREDNPDVPITPRPVTVLNLATTDPAERLQLTGSAKAFREEDLAFEVGGRLEYVVETGTEIGAAWGESEGGIVARIDDTRYQVVLDSAKAGLDSAVAETETLQAQLEHVLPANLEAAKATTAFRVAELKRYQEAIKTKAVSQSDLDEKRAALDVALAGEKEIEANMKSVRARIESSRAQQAVQRQRLREATIDLESCTLRAPYPAEVAQVHTIPGAVVQPGEPVCTLTVMNPIIVAVSVSAQVNERLRRGDTVQLSDLGAGFEGYEGTVFRKSTSADPKTRTYEVEVITRNLRVSRTLSGSPEWRELPRVNEVFDLTSITTDPEELVDRTRSSGVLPGKPWYINMSCVEGDEASGYHAWRLKGLTSTDTNKVETPIFELERIPVKLGEKSIDVFGLYRLREIVKDGNLNARDVFAAEVPDGVKDGDRIAWVRDEWLIRPGALVRVQLDTEAPSPGLYVPMRSIQLDTQDRPFCFIAARDEKKQLVARKVSVEITGSIGESKRIEGPDIEIGTQVIVDGVHYLSDGEAINIAGEVESR